MSSQIILGPIGWLPQVETNLLSIAAQRGAGAKWRQKRLRCQSSCMYPVAWYQVLHAIQVLHT